MASTNGVADAATRSLSMITTTELPYIEALYIADLCMSTTNWLLSKDFLGLPLQSSPHINRIWIASCRARSEGDRCPLFPLGCLETAISAARSSVSVRPQTFRSRDPASGGVSGPARAARASASRRIGLGV